MIRWNKELETKLAKLYPCTRNDEIASIMGITIPAVQSRAKKMKLRKNKGSRSLPSWAAERRVDIEEMIALYKTHTNTQLASRYGITKAVVKNLAAKYGMKKLPEHTNDGRFKPGHVPWSAGKKGKGILKANSGSFKKGFTPHNTKKDGFISIRKNNKTGYIYKWIRISEKHWELLQRYVWEQYNGPIPKGNNIIFKDGDAMNCDITNLEMVSDRELRIRNSGSVNLTDEYIVAQMARNNKELQKELLVQPELIEVQRQSYKLKRATNE